MTFFQRPRAVFYNAPKYRENKVSKILFAKLGWSDGLPWTGWLLRIFALLALCLVLTLFGVHQTKGGFGSSDFWIITALVFGVIAVITSSGHAALAACATCLLWYVFLDNPPAWLPFTAMPALAVYWLLSAWAQHISLPSVTSWASCIKLLFALLAFVTGSALVAGAIWVGSLLPGPGNLLLGLVTLILLIGLLSLVKKTWVPEYEE